MSGENDPSWPSVNKANDVVTLCIFIDWVGVCLEINDTFDSFCHEKLDKKWSTETSYICVTTWRIIAGFLEIKSNEAFFS